MLARSMHCAWCVCACQRSLTLYQHCEAAATPPPPTASPSPPPLRRRRPHRCLCAPPPHTLPLPCLSTPYPYSLPTQFTPPPPPSPLSSPPPLPLPPRLCALTVTCSPSVCVLSCALVMPCTSQRAGGTRWTAQVCVRCFFGGAEVRKIGGTHVCVKGAWARRVCRQGCIPRLGLFTCS